MHRFRYVCIGDSPLDIFLPVQASFLPDIRKFPGQIRPSCATCVFFQGTSVGAVFGFVFGMWVGMGSYAIKRHLDVLPTPTANCTQTDDVITQALIYTTSAAIATSPTAGADVESSVR